MAFCLFAHAVPSCRQTEATTSVVPSRLTSAREQTVQYLGAQGGERLLAPLVPTPGLVCVALPAACCSRVVPQAFCRLVCCVECHAPLWCDACMLLLSQGLAVCVQQCSAAVGLLLLIKPQKQLRPHGFVADVCCLQGPCAPAAHTHSNACACAPIWPCTFVGHSSRWAWACQASDAVLVSG